MRLLGVPTALNTFKSFPDLEETEYLVRHRPTGAIRGASFIPSPIADFVVLAWRRDRAAFDDNAWLIPAADIPHLVRVDLPTSRIELRIGITRGSRFDKHRMPREAIATAIEQRMR